MRVPMMRPRGDRDVSTHPRSCAQCDWTCRRLTAEAANAARDWHVKSAHTLTLVSPDSPVLEPGLWD